MKKNIFFLLLLSCSYSSAQFEFKADMTKENLLSNSYSYTIGETLFTINSQQCLATNLTSGITISKNWQDLEGKFFNNSNLNKNSIFISETKGTSKNGNLYIILPVLKDSDKSIFVKVEINKNLKLVSDEILLEYESRVPSTQKTFSRNLETGESVYIEYDKKEKETDFIRAVFFNKDLELVSNKKISFGNVPFKNNYGGTGVKNNSIFAVSSNTALLNVNDKIFYIKDDELKLLDIGVKTDINNYLVRPASKNGFTLIGYYNNYYLENNKDEHGLIIVDFDNELNQKSKNYIPLSNNILASCENQIASDFSKQSCGFLDLIEVFVENDASIRVLARTINMKNYKGGGLVNRANLSLININAQRQLINANTIPTKSNFFETFLNTKEKIKVILIDSPKFYDKKGDYIPNSELKGGNPDFSALAIIEMDNETGKIFSRSLLKFNNNELDIKGTIVKQGEIFGNKHAQTIKIFKYGKSDLFIGELK